MQGNNLFPTVVASVNMTGNYVFNVSMLETTTTTTIGLKNEDVNNSPNDNYDESTILPIPVTTIVQSNNQTETSSRRKREDIPTTNDKDDYETSIYLPVDGILNDKANYTSFIEVIGRFAIHFLHIWVFYWKINGLLSLQCMDRARDNI